MKLYLTISIGVLCNLLTACDDEMADQPHFEPMESSKFFADGTSARTPPDGTIARGSSDDSLPPPVTRQWLEHGRELYTVHCAVCHGADGYGKGIIVRRGFPPPPSYHTDRLRQVPDAHIFNVITMGYGKMYPYRARVAPADRWAIVAFVRALQLSQKAQFSDVIDPAARDRLEKERGAK